MKWNEGIRDILYLNRSGNENNITYCLGCCGEVVGRDKIVENNFKHYYSHGWDKHIGLDGAGLQGWFDGMDVNSAWALWSSVNKDKQVFDCSGLVCWFAGLHGQHIYSSWNVATMPKNDSISSGVAGSILWKSGHVAIDIGYGFCIEIGTWNDGIKRNLINERNFVSSHLMVGVDYSGSNSR